MSRFAALAGRTTPCGELACQKDSMLRTLTTRVVSCTLRAAPPPAPSGGGKKGKKDITPLWDVVLADTVLFPEGGGQPADCGTVGGVPCTRVDNVDGVAVHALSLPFEAGIEVEVEVDFARRWDHATQHSAQHLITALALKKWGVPTVSWGLGLWAGAEEAGGGGAESSGGGGGGASFLELGTPSLDAAAVAELEEEVNEAIRGATTVAPSWHPAADAVEGKVPGLRVSSKALPESAMRGDVRVVTFEGIDTNLCCGTHVPTTAHLQAIKFLKVERCGGGGGGGGGGGKKKKKKKKATTEEEPTAAQSEGGEGDSSSSSSSSSSNTAGTVKLWYVAGPRVLGLLGEGHRREAAVGARLSVAPQQIPGRVDDLLTRERAAGKALKALTAEVANLTAQSLLAQVRVQAKAEAEAEAMLAKAAASAGSPQNQGEGEAATTGEEEGAKVAAAAAAAAVVVATHRVLPAGLGSDSAVDFMKGLATAVVDSPDRARGSGGDGSGGGVDVLLLCTVSSEDGGDGMFLVAASAGRADLVAAAAPAVAAVLEGRGGGRGERFQGKCGAVGRREEALDAANAALSAAGLL